MPKSDEKRSHLTGKRKPLPPPLPERLKQFEFNDGGRAAAGITGSSGDCVVRAIAIATSKSYTEVHDALQNGLRHQIEIERKEELQYGIARRTRPMARPLTGVTHDVYTPYLKWLGWEYFPKPVGA